MKTVNDIQKEFNGVTGLNEAKKVFKRLAKSLHPDIGGSEEEFKLLKNVYDNIIEHKVYFSNDSKFDIELEKVIAQILHYEDITIDVVGSWIWLSGNTKPLKDTLKKLNFKWASKKKMWYYGEMKGKSHKEQSLDEIKGKYGCTTIKSKGYEKLSA